jgi:hypothetical protein
MTLNKQLKDWQIAFDMFGKNTKHECDIVKKLRKKATIRPLCEGWSVISGPGDEVGWLISDENLLGDGDVDSPGDQPLVVAQRVNQGDGRLVSDVSEGRGE